MILPCPHHPDTGVLIEGQIPLWDKVKEVVQKICLTIPELEYLGFDIAITDHGVKVLEINKHQDLHRNPEYGEEVQRFFRDKINQKKQLVL